MPVGLYTGPNLSTGNGVTTVFPYTFRILQNADLDVYLDGVLQSSGYAVSGVGDPSGGNVTFSVAPANGVTVLREREASYDRATDYQRNGSFDEQTVDADFDRVVMLSQQLKALSNRSLKIPNDTTLSAEDVIFHPVANTAIGWNATGDDLINIALSTGTGLVDLAAASGSALIGTQIQSGAPVRTLADRARDMISIFDLGTFTAAQVADVRARTKTLTCGAAITASITAAITLGCSLWAPHGTYNINDGITGAAWAGFQLNGAGINNTIFSKSANGTAMAVTGAARGKISGIAFVGTGMTTGDCLVLDGSGAGVMEVRDCQMADFPGRGIYANFTAGNPASDMDFIHNIILSCGVTVGTPQAEYRYCNDSSWSQNQYGTLTGGSPQPTFGAYHYECKASDFGPSNYHWNNVVGAKYENCDYSEWHANRWEENGHEGAQFLNCTRSLIAGNRWHSNSASATDTYDGVTLTTCAIMTVSDNACFTFTANEVRDGLNIASDCSSITIADNVFSAFSRRPVTWTRTAFDTKLTGNLPSGYGINQGNPPIYSKAVGLAAGQTRFLGLGAASAAEADTLLCGPEETIMLTNMRVILSAAPGAGQSITVTVRRNAADTAHVCTIADGNFTGSFVAAVGSEVLVGIGESFGWKAVASAGAATSTVTVAQTTAI